jgi:hypothetical protein
MSTGLECALIEITRGKWYYILENGWEREEGENWLEHATAYGPFASEEAADEHLTENHSNPGGVWTNALPEGRETLIRDTDTTLKGLIDRAQKPTARRTFSSSFRR